MFDTRRQPWASDNGRACEGRDWATRRTVRCRKARLGSVPTVPFPAPGGPRRVRQRSLRPTRKRSELHHWVR